MEIVHKSDRLKINFVEEKKVKDVKKNENIFNKMT